MPVLVGLLEHGAAAHERAQAAVALGRVENEAAVDALRKALSDPEEIVRIEAAAQLARRGRRDGDELLLTALGSPVTGTRTIAFRAIPHVGEPARARARLGELLEPRPEEAKLPARERLLLSFVRNDVLREMARWEVEALRPLAPALERLLGDEQEGVWKLAAALLRTLGYTVERVPDAESGRVAPRVLAEPE